MAHSEREILSKIGDLLVEINEEYASIEQDEQNYDTIKLGLLIAKTQYLAAHLEVLRQASSTFAPSASTPDSKESIEFTPASEATNQDADKQATYEEIVEVDSAQVSFENEAYQTLEEDVEDPSPDEAVDDLYQEELEVENTDGQENDHVEIQESVDPQSEHDAEDHDGHGNIESDITTAPVSSEPESHKKEEIRADQQPVDHNASIQQEAVVNQVIEEQREVVVPQQEAPVVQEEPKPARPLTLNEIIQQQKKAGLTNANQFSTSASRTDQVLDLKAAVSLNDKLLFIKDLFNGYSLAYTEAIELLNRFDNFSEADAFLQANYALKNNWVSKPQTVDKLYAILRKKFG